jgi:hypothetical protein
MIYLLLFLLFINLVMIINMLYRWVVYIIEYFVYRRMEKIIELRKSVEKYNL